MNKHYLFSGTGLFKIGTVILGCAAFFTGLYTHLESDWRKKHLYLKCENCPWETECDHVSGFRLNSCQKHAICPGIKMEVFFVVVISINLLISLLFLTVGLHAGISFLQQRIFKLVDFAFHILAGIFAFVSGCLVIYTAAGIDKFLEKNQSDGCVEDTGDTFLIGGKIVAGVLAMKLGLLYCITAVSILRDSSPQEFSLLQ